MSEDNIPKLKPNSPISLGPSTLGYMGGWNDAEASTREACKAAIRAACQCVPDGSHTSSGDLVGATWDELIDKAKRIKKRDLPICNCCIRAIAAIDAMPTGKDGAK